MSVVPPDASAGGSDGRIARSPFRRIVRLAAPFAGLAVAWTLFAVLAGGPFLSIDNQRLMLLQTAVVGTAAVGATIIIISGGIDLSVGSTIAIVTMIVALLLSKGSGPWLATLGGVGLAAVIGLSIGWLVIGHGAWVLGLGAGGVVAAFAWRWGGTTALALGLAAAAGATFVLRRRLGRLPLSPFIVTLGMWGAVRGLAKGIGGSQPIYPSLEARGWLDRLMSLTGGIGPVPIGVIVLVATALVAAAMLRYTVLGRHIVATGSNEHAARLCGVPVARVKLLTYVIGVACAGIAGVLQFSFLTMGDPTTAGGYELKVIAAAVIGGASLAGGEGSIVGALAGALLMTVVDNGCTKMGLDNWVQETVTGAIIVAAVAVDRLRR
ncbi:MAG: ABC transporter permease [Phycisphaerales bacterium]|nr:ABC transporter permease [Phycisphaerales bacterium]